MYVYMHEYIHEGIQRQFNTQNALVQEIVEVWWISQALPLN